MAKVANFSPSMVLATFNPLARLETHRATAARPTAIERVRDGGIYFRASSLVSNLAAERRTRVLAPNGSVESFSHI